MRERGLKRRGLRDGKTERKREREKERRREGEKERERERDTDSERKRDGGGGQNGEGTAVQGCKFGTHVTIFDLQYTLEIRQKND